MSAGRPLVVLGDALLDIDTVGAARRLSPDGPVPVVEDAVDTVRAGGAALTAALAARDGAPVRLVVPLADDDDARRIAAALPPAVELVAVPWAGATPVRNRIRAGGQTVARVDRGGARGALGPVPPAALAGAAAVVVADYGHGVTADPAVRELLAGGAGRRPLVWDPHPRGGDPLPGTTLVTPNAVEACGLPAGAPVPPLAAIAARAAALRDGWGARAVAVTLGPGGALLVDGAGDVAVVPCPPAVPVAGVVPDTCGAGDRFAATAALALAGGALPSEAVEQAVAAASAFVAAGGLHARAAAAPRVPTLVATGGCFDLLHAGHVATLEAARRLGDRLVVCLNSDASVRRLKGPGRPLQPAADRRRVLEALACVDEVVVFDEDTPAQVIERLRPDLWVKGGDYAGADVPERAVLERWGGRVVTVPFLSGRSTTSLAARAAAGHR